MCSSYVPSHLPLFAFRPVRIPFSDDLIHFSTLWGSSADVGFGLCHKPMDLILRPCFVSAKRSRNAPFCALGTAPCRFFNPWMHSITCGHSAFLRAEKAWSTGPLACHAISKQTCPLSTAAFECLRVAAAKFHVHPPGVPKGSPTGYIRPSYPKTRHLRRRSAMCHICFTIARNFLYGAFLCFPFKLPSTSVFTQCETNWKTPSPPSPFCHHFQEPAPPPLDNSMAHSFIAPVVEHAPLANLPPAIGAWACIYYFGGLRPPRNWRVGMR